MNHMHGSNALKRRSFLKGYGQLLGSDLILRNTVIQGISDSHKKLVGFSNMFVA